MLAAVREDLPERCLDFIQDHDETCRVNDLERLRQKVALRNAVGETVERRVERAQSRVLTQALGTVWRERFLTRLEVGQDVAEVLRVERLADAEETARWTRVARHLPDAREIRLAIQSWRRCR